MRNRRCAPLVRHTFLTLPVLGAALALAVGCEPRDSAVSTELAEAIELVQLAGGGYVPSDYADQFDPVDFKSFRQAMLDQALSRLETIARTGDGEDRLAAREMLADIHASAAHHLAHEASHARAELAGDLGALRASLRHVTLAHSRVAMLGLDRSAVDRELRAQAEAMRQERGELESLHAELEQELAELEQRRAAYRADARAARSEEHQLRNDAFALDPGDERHELLNAATAAERRAAEHDAEADQLDALMERRTSERDTAAVEIQTIDALLDELAEQRERWAASEQARAEERERTEANHLDVARTLMDRFDRADERYWDQVHEPFETARQRMGEAVELLEQLADQARGADRLALQHKLLATRVDQVQLIVDQATAAARFGRALGTLADRAPDVLPADVTARAVVEARDRIAERQRELVDAGTDAAQVGQALATELGNVDDPRLQSYADRQRTRFARHMETLDDQRL